MIFMMMFIAMIIVAVISLTTMAYALIWPKKKIQHNKCHTDNMKIEDLHGHMSRTEPHVSVGSESYYVCHRGRV